MTEDYAMTDQEIEKMATSIMQKIAIIKRWDAAWDKLSPIEQGGVQYVKIDEASR